MTHPLDFPIPGQEDNGRAGGRFSLTLLFWFLLAVTTALRLVYALKFPLTGDEAYFWEWARHPAMGYYDHPPMAGWILWVSRHIFGDTLQGCHEFVGSVEQGDEQDKRQYPIHL